MSLKLNKIHYFHVKSCYRFLTPPLRPSPILLASSALGVRPAHFIDASAAYGSTFCQPTGHNYVSCEPQGY